MASAKSSVQLSFGCKTWQKNRALFAATVCTAARVNVVALAIKYKVYIYMCRFSYFEKGLGLISQLT